MNKILMVLASLNVIKNKYNAIKYLLALYNSGDVVLETYDNIKFKVKADRRNKPIFYTIYELFCKNIYPVEGDKPLTIIDAGAQVGGFTVYAVSKNVNNKVYALEPDPINYEYLLDNARINNIENRIIPLNIALYSQNATILFNQNSKSSRSGSIYNLEGKLISVKAITLEELFSMHNIEKCDILKMDIEGAEYDVIYSTPQKTLTKISKIYMECHTLSDKDQCNIESMKKHLEQQGFTILNDVDSVITAVNNISE